MVHGKSMNNDVHVINVDIDQMTVTCGSFAILGFASLFLSSKHVTFASVLMSMVVAASVGQIYVGTRHMFDTHGTTKGDAMQSHVDRGGSSVSFPINLYTMKSYIGRYIGTTTFD